MGFARPAVSVSALLRLALHGGMAGDPGHAVNRKQVQRLMAIYQQPNTSKAAAARKVYPYLLGGIAIERVNQVWCSDVTPA
jgi:transposase InsO family protein